ncbi:MAG: BACON domain-containing protein [Victivallales bacterium]|nr:BACON domain-containing protein [Victivallales bacterium]
MDRNLQKYALIIMLATLSAVAATNDFSFSFGNSFTFGMGATAEQTPYPISGGTFSPKYYFLSSGDKTSLAEEGMQYLNTDIRVSTTAATWKIYSSQGGQVTFAKQGTIPSGATLAIYNANSQNKKIADVANGTKVTLEPNSTYYIQFAEKGKTVLPPAPNNKTFNLERSSGKQLEFPASDLLPEGYTLPSGYTLAGDKAAYAFDVDGAVFSDGSFGTITYKNNKCTLTLPNDIDSSIAILKFFCWFKASSGSTVTSNGMITINLTQAPPYLSLEPSSATVSSMGGDALSLGIDFEVQSNVTWTVRSTVDWIVPTTIEGININRVSYIVSPSTNEETREGKLIVESNRTPPQEFTLTQGKALPEKTTLPLAAGWNFIAFTHQLNNETIAELLKKYAIFAINAKGKGYSLATSLTPGVPYWIYSPEQKTEEFTGYILDKDWKQPTIKNGKWIFVGVSTKNYSPGSNNTIWAWNAEMQQFDIMNSVSLGNAFMIQSSN